MNDIHFAMFIVGSMLSGLALVGVIWFFQQTRLKIPSAEAVERAMVVRDGRQLGDQRVDEEGLRWQYQGDGFWNRIYPFRSPELPLQETVDRQYPKRVEEGWLRNAAHERAYRKRQQERNHDRLAHGEWP